MEYQKPIHLLDNTRNESSQFRTKNWVEINEHSRVECIAPTTKLNLRLWCWSQDSVIIVMYIYLLKDISIVNTADAGIVGG